KLPPPPAAAKDEDDEADASTQSPENKTKKKRTKKDEKFNEFGEEIVKEKVVGAADVGVTDSVAGGKRRVVKKRFVEKTEMDANGYIHTTTIEEEYSDYEEGTPPKKKKEEKRSSGVHVENHPSGPGSLKRKRTDEAPLRWTETREKIPKVLWRVTLEFL
ncbi:hypothetical protein TrCOL_g10935, partial [Triparma columacea]